MTREILAEPLFTLHFPHSPLSPLFTLHFPTLDYLSHSFRAQRLEGIGRTAMFNSVLDDLAARPLDDFAGLHFFHPTQSPFSQGHEAGFALSGITYTSVEQYVMCARALLFDDREMAHEVLATAEQNSHERLGREVGNFDAAIWRDNARRIAYEGNCGKFMQNRELRDQLTATGNALLVEAAPDDTVWGIGLAGDDERARSKASWRGKNWQGYVLTLLREDVRAFAKTI